MVDQTISYNDKSIARRGWGEEAHNSQRLFFIQKELQLDTKFHYIEVAATSKNYKITLCISKITVKRKSFFTSAYTLSRQKTQKKKKSQEREREREEKRVRTRRKRKRRRKRRKGKKRRKKRKKTERAVSSTPPPPNTFPSTIPSLDIAMEQHNSHKGGTREKHNSYKQ